MALEPRHLRDAARLLAFGLQPAKRPTNDPDYDRLVRAARDEPEVALALTELAAGVVVPDAELARAEGVLGLAAPEVVAPVAVGGQRALLAGGPAQLVVLPPLAAYDSSQALPERERRREEENRRGQRREELSTVQRDLDRLRASLEQHLAEFPAEWFEEASRRRELHGQAARTLAADSNAQRAEADRHREGMERSRTSAKLQRQAGREAAGRLRTVVAFCAEGGSALEKLGAEVTKLARELEGTREALTSLAAESAKLAQQREARRRDAEAIASDEKELGAERELAGRYAKPGLPLPSQPLALARERFELLRRRFEQATGHEALTAKLEAVSEEISRASAELERVVAADGLLMNEVESALEAAVESVGLLETERRLREAVGAARATVAEAKADAVSAGRELDKAFGDLQGLRSQGRARHVDEAAAESSGWPLEQLRRAVGEERSAAEVAQEEETGAAKSRDEAKARADRGANEAAKLAACSTRLSDALAAVGSLLPPRARPEPAGALVQFEGAEALAGERVEAVGRSAERLRAVQKEAEMRARQLGLFAHEAAQQVLPALLRDRLAELDLGVLLSRAADYLGDVEQRAAVVAQELESVERHRSVLATQLQAASDPALRLLKRLEGASVFPAAVDVWGGQPFVQVRLKVPDSAEERSGITATLLDQFIASKEIHSGLQLVKRAVRELTRGGGLHVRILKPEAHRRLVYEPVDRLRAFSRGEQLTSAILLYCTLAKLRALSRGGLQAPTSVLVLDNPLGTCSNPALVELQRSMAAAHGVQLVYTTGIEDLEALSRMQNVIRLRNSHLDVRGRRRVTVEDEPPPLESARISVREAS